MTVPPVANGGAAAGMVLGAVFALVVHTSAADAVVSLLIGVGGTLGFGKVPPMPASAPSSGRRSAKTFLRHQVLWGNLALLVGAGGSVRVTGLVLGLAEFALIGVAGLAGWSA